MVPYINKGMPNRHRSQRVNMLSILGHGSRRRNQHFGDAGEKDVGIGFEALTDSYVARLWVNKKKCKFGNNSWFLPSADGF